MGSKFDFLIKFRELFMFLFTFLLYSLVFNDCTNQMCKSVLSCSCHLIYLSHFRNPEFKRRDLVLIKIVQKVTNLSVTEVSLTRMFHI